ncbi:hypothetical protein, partial [Nonomuraea rhizosphaerae]|uniref:hypothetical protein n=1 Tax=Nonomuraea rhizosphaerae TaxID=2665663 RepID=UPI001C5F3F2B
AGRPPVATPMADFTYRGGLTQSDLGGTAQGMLAFVGDGDTATDWSMRVESVGETHRVVVMESTGRTYLDGKRVRGEPTAGAYLLAMLIPATGGIGVVLEMIGLTPKVSRQERTYSGSLLTTKGPQTVQVKLSEITGGWTTAELARTQLTWKLTLDELDRPTRFALSWRALNDNSRISSSFTTTYAKWRTGKITAPRRTAQ